MEALYEQRIGDYGPSSCYSAEYARFKLNTHGDAQGAIDLARDALDLNCDDAPWRQTARPAMLTTPAVYT